MKKYFLLLFMMLGTTLTVLAQEDIEISGVVTESNGEPIIGASVTVKDAKGLGTITNANGQYKIKAKTYQTLVFAYLGFNSVEVLLKGDKTVVDITLSEEIVNELDDVIVTAMGTQKKLTVTGAITNVNMGDLKHYTSSNLSNTLAGNVPGVIAYQTSGQPGKNSSEFWIRGISTFGASTSAYILVDGFERENIDELNIEDIESFTVLKDASATAIYGSKGANGVVLITTKRGKAGKINVNGKFEVTYNTRTITPEFVDGVTYAELLNEARITRSLGAAYSDEEIALIKSGLDPDLYPNVDWADILLKDGAWSYRGNVNLSGGGNTSRYYASISYVEDEGMYKTDSTLRDKYDTNANYKRWNYRLNVDIDITPTTVMKLGVSGDLNKRNSPGVGDDYVWGELFGYNALLTPITYSNGYIPHTNLGDGYNYVNPWVAATQTGYNEEWTNNLYSNVSLEQNLDFVTKGLKFTARFGYDTYNYNEISHIRMPATYAATGRADDGSINWTQMTDNEDMSQSSSNDGSRREFIELLLNYNRTFGSVHNVGANARFTQDVKIQTQDLGTDIKNSVSQKNMALAAQVTYNYANRYFLDYNFGYNGTENFADGHRWGFFPAWSLAWNIGEEPFVRNALPWLNMFKVRFSYGKVGSDDIDERFPYLYTLEDTSASYNFGTSTYDNTYTGVHYSQLASNEVTWEVARKTDLGVDLDLFNSMFTATFDYFYEKRTGQFQTRSYIPAMAGFESSPWANIGAAESRGFDGNFAFNKQINKDWSLTLRGNITYSKSEVLEYDEEFSAYGYQSSIGYRINQQTGLIALGLFADYDDIRNSPEQQFGDVQPGDIKYKDVNGDGVVDDNDVVAIGCTDTPNLIYGVGFTVRYKDFDLNMHFQGAGKSTFDIYGKCVFAFSEGQWGNIFKGMLDNRWISADISGTTDTENVNASYPRLSYGGNTNNQQTSTFWLRDGRYFRLKNFDFGYSLPKSIVNKLHFNTIRVYMTGTNLLTWSKFDYWDPETLQPRGEEYPLTKSVTLGVQFNL